LGVFISAYANTKTGEIAVVVINSNNFDEEITLNLNGAVFSSLNTWRTSENENLALIDKASPRKNTMYVRLARKSISTLYGTVKLSHGG